MCTNCTLASGEVREVVNRSLGLCTGLHRNKEKVSLVALQWFVRVAENTVIPSEGELQALIRVFRRRTGESCCSLQDFEI